MSARKVRAVPGGLSDDVPDSLAAWATRYLALVVVGVRSPAVTQKIALHLDRFVAFFVDRSWRDRAIVYVFLSTGLRREELLNLNLDQFVP